MWGKRLGQEISTKPEFIKPENQVKLTILWAILEIFKESCQAVDETYIYMLGHLFAMHLKHMWNADGYNDTSTTPEQWEVTREVFDYCTEHMSEIVRCRKALNTFYIISYLSINFHVSVTQPYYDGSCKSGDEFGRLPDVKNGFSEEDSSWFEIVNGEVFDPVIEQMWLIINFVLPACNVVSGYINNDWSDLVVLFHENFLDPLKDIWQEEIKTHILFKCIINYTYYFNDIFNGFS